MDNGEVSIIHCPLSIIHCPLISTATGKSLLEVLQFGRIDRLQLVHVQNRCAADERQSRPFLGHAVFSLPCGRIPS